LEAGGESILEEIELLLRSLLLLCGRLLLLRSLLLLLLLLLRSRLLLCLRLLFAGLRTSCQDASRRSNRRSFACIVVGYFANNRSGGCTAHGTACARPTRWLLRSRLRRSRGGCR
jgi:hypothetical protein